MGYFETGKPSRVTSPRWSEPGIDTVLHPFDHGASRQHGLDGDSAAAAPNQPDSSLPVLNRKLGGVRTRAGVEQAAKRPVIEGGVEVARVDDRAGLRRDQRGKAMQFPRPLRRRLGPGPAMWVEKTVIRPSERLGSMSMLAETS